MCEFCKMKQTYDDGTFHVYTGAEPLEEVDPGCNAELLLKMMLDDNDDCGYIAMLDYSSHYTWQDTVHYRINELEDSFEMDIHAGDEGVSFAVNYCPLCGRKLTEVR